MFFKIKKLIILSIVLSSSVMEPRAPEENFGQLPKQQISQELVQETFDKIDRNICNISENDVRVFARRMNLIVGDELYKDVLLHLQSKIADELQYYESKMLGKVDSNTISSCARVGAVALATGALSYYIYTRWYKASNDEFSALKTRLADMNVITEESRSYFGFVVRHTIYIDYPHNLSLEQVEYVKKAGERLVGLYKTANESIWYAFYPGFISGVYSLILCAQIWDLFFPNCDEYKGQYEGFLLVSQELEKIIETI